MLMKMTEERWIMDSKKRIKRYHTGVTYEVSPEIAGRLSGTQEIAVNPPVVSVVARNLKADKILNETLEKVGRT